MPSVVNRKERFISDIVAKITSDTSNVVRIVLEDGEIVANKEVLSARSEYFATMFSNKMFIEEETNCVSFNLCSKAIIEKIIQYICSGKVELHVLSLTDLVSMMNMTTMMMLDDLKGDIQQYILEIIPRSGENYSSLPQLVESLMLAEQFKLDTIKKAIFRELFLSLDNIPHIPDVVKNFDAFKRLPYKLLEEAYFGETDDDELKDEDDQGRIPENPMKVFFDAFVFWLSENDITAGQKEKFKDFFQYSDFEFFSAEELLTDLRKSGLYTIEEIDKRVLEICRKKDQEIDDYEKLRECCTDAIQVRDKKIDRLSRENRKMKAILKVEAWKHGEVFCLDEALTGEISTQEINK